jgi:formylglycine-generating enzyme required for sulfatase activity/V8-like Glu-specific endopeptidase
MLNRAIAIATALVGLPLAAAAQIATFNGSIHHLDPVVTQSTGNRVLEQLLSGDQMQPIREFGQTDIIRRLARPVGRLTLQFKGGEQKAAEPGQRGAYCTASLIGPDLILTNHHCVPGNGDVTQALLTMGYLQPRTRQGVAQYPVNVRPVEASKDLDYAILRVEGRPGDEWGTIPLSAETPEALHSLFIVHHPGGYPQYVTQGRCQTSNPAIDGSDILHICDTLPGSSGAPIFDNSTRKVVGLHYSAVEMRKLNAGKRMASIATVSSIIGGLVRQSGGTAAPAGETAEMKAMRERLAALEAQLKAHQKTAANVQPVPIPAPASPAPKAGPAPKAFRSGEAFRDCPECPEMVVLPLGSFMMGSPANEEGRSADEGPQRKVTIARSFAVGKFEVTFAEWDACMADRGCTHKPGDHGFGRGKRPVINVSWDDAKQYAAWLSRKTSQSYRLLTEAEWEYAARGGTTTPFSTGRTITTAQANFDGNYTYGGSAKGQYRQRTIEVGSFAANPFGIHDMHGNVWEWVEDCYVDSYNSAPVDGSARSVTANCSRVLRGGSWDYIPQNLRAAGRYRDQPDVRSSDLGFRLARTLPPSP